jgi:putative flippase GtrA
MKTLLRRKCLHEGKNMINKVFTYFFKKSFFIYGLIGAFVTIVQISFLFLLRDYFKVYDFISVTSAYIVALLVHYFLNKHVTFLVIQRKVFNMMSLRYMAVVIVSYLIYVMNIFLLNRIVGLEFSIALFITLGINYVLNYILYRNFVFYNK